ncbi:hypothetical protein C1I92_12990 [Jiangella anatolica]|uniref:Nucleic acid-binding protein n=2 Tax=Jiangella anatolica TaxID=2670374 RepID=A0A2W2B7B0_9ACTN|nr:hypothetical protein C1I92_12990 [Jiangella anatolica]
MEPMTTTGVDLPDDAVDADDWFEVPDELHYYYSYSYGGVSRFFREIVDNQRLTVTRCELCDRGYCPPRRDCPRCWERTTWQPHPGTGTVVAPVYCYWTQINSPVRRYVQPPFVYALVRLDGMTNALHTLIHTDDLRVNRTVRVGTRVEVRFREQRRGTLADVYFVPVEQP